MKINDLLSHLQKTSKTSLILINITAKKSDIPKIVIALHQLSEFFLPTANP